LIGIETDILCPCAFKALGSLFLSLSPCMNIPHLLFLIDTFKIYISPRRLKGALRTMAYSAPAVHHWVPLVCVIEIAIVGKRGPSILWLL
jgi:hypothetical protein